MVEGVVETNSSESPVMGTPLVSMAVATIGCGLFWLTSTGLAVEPGVVRVIEAGGQVEKMPAELAALAMFAEISTDPGWFAVATPFWSMLTTDEIEVVDVSPCALNCRWPARQLMLVWLAPVPA